MKAITIHVDEPVYKDFQNFARQKQRSTSDLIREAMLQYHNQVTKENQPSILDAPPPRSVGKILKPFSSRAEMLEDFWERE